MKQSFFIFLIVFFGVICIASCTKKRNCTCTTGGTYEIIDSDLVHTYGYPVQITTFDTVLTQECFTLNYHDTTDIAYPANGVIMNAFLTCTEK